MTRRGARREPPPGARNQGRRIQSLVREPPGTTGKPAGTEGRGGGAVNLGARV